ncbi:MULTISPECIES: hypothetical protein [unclassified Sphingomonas]|jgi:hypothetical protein|uniref:hypothetical protein n=1 Tax=unclassified Sphingomonas TaxID=196159 RepID=UPI00082B2BFD|nr:MULTISPECIES: hypothetical protein [unclassified Sphingomonas]
MFWLLFLASVEVDAEASSVRDAAPAKCERPAMEHARTGGATTVEPLVRQPLAVEEKAVWRRDERGCTQPVVVRRNVGQ